MKLITLKLRNKTNGLVTKLVVEAMGSGIDPIDEQTGNMAMTRSAVGLCIGHKSCSPLSTAMLGMRHQHVKDKLLLVYIKVNKSDRRSELGARRDVSNAFAESLRKLANGVRVQGARGMRQGEQLRPDKTDKLGVVGSGFAGTNHNILPIRRVAVGCDAA